MHALLWDFLDLPDMFLGISKYHFLNWCLFDTYQLEGNDPMSGIVLKADEGTGRETMAPSGTSVTRKKHQSPSYFSAYFPHNANFKMTLRSLKWET